MKKHRFFVLTLALTGLVLSFSLSCGGTDETVVSSQSLSSTQKASIQTIADNAIVKYEVPGISFAVKYYGQTVHAGTAGFSDNAQTTPLTSDHLMRIGSASKTFVAMSVLRLVREGDIWLDQPVTKVLPNLTATLSNYDITHLTIRMLIQHTSGLASYTESDTWALEYIQNRTKVWTDADLLKIVNDGNDPASGEYASMKQVGTPGLKWSYSNTNYVLLGMVVEAASGSDVGTYITDTFITPLGLSKTHYPKSGESWPSSSGSEGDTYSRGHIDWANFFGLGFLPGYTDATQYDPSGVGAAGPMVSTPSDLCQWIEAIVANDILIGSTNKTLLDWRTYLATGPSSDNWNELVTFGMGLAHEPDSNNSSNYYVCGHRGQISGFDTAMITIPEKQCSIVVIANRSLKNAVDSEGNAWPNNALALALNDMVAEIFPDLVSAGKLPDGAAMPSRKAEVNLSQRPLTEY